MLVLQAVRINGRRYRDQSIDTVRFAFIPIVYNWLIGMDVTFLLFILSKGNIPVCQWSY